MTDTSTMRRLAVTPTLAALSYAAPAVQAHPADAPRLTASGGRQTGRVVTYQVTRRDGRYCSVLHADGFRDTPDPVTHDGSPLTWRIADSRRPTKVSVVLTRQVVNGVSLGDPESVAVRVTAVKTRAGRVEAWQVTTGDVGAGDLRLDLHVEWRGSCGTDSGSYVYRVTPPLIV